jgi:RNase P subunit RPR2
MTSQLPALKPVCPVCGAALIRTRQYRRGLCPDCHRMRCAICNQPIYYGQSFRATAQGHYHHLACRGHGSPSAIQLPAP